MPTNRFLKDRKSLLIVVVAAGTDPKNKEYLYLSVN